MNKFGTYNNVNRSGNGSNIKNVPHGWRGGGPLSEARS